MIASNTPAEAPIERYFAVPRRALRPYIDRLWGWESATAPELSLLLPGTGAELMFHYGTPMAIQTLAGRRPSLGSAYLLCARNAPHQPLPQGGVGFVSVRFRSGALRHFCPLPLVALLDDAVPISDIWGASGREIAERVALAPCRRERMEALQDWLQSCLARHGRTQPAIETALHALYYRHRDVRIEALAERIGMSRRHFERKFREQIGLTPKSFQRIARFHHTVRELMLAGHSDYLGTALDHGYYDQAHFIHDFTGLVGSPPGGFIQDALRSAHFYNRPIFSADKVSLPR